MENIDEHKQYFWKRSLLPHYGMNVIFRPHEWTVASTPSYFPSASCYCMFCYFLSIIIGSDQRSEPNNLRPPYDQIADVNLTFTSCLSITIVFEFP